MAALDKPSPLLLRIAGLAACAVAATPVWIELGQGRGAARTALSLAGFALFAALFWPLTDERTRCGLSPRAARALLAGLASTGIGLHLLVAHNMTGMLLVLVASVTFDLIPRAAAYALLALQTLVFAAAVVPGMESWWGLVSVAAYGTFEIFAFYVSLIAQAERRGREELARTHAELLATRHLLAESSRAAERVRIARELHDVMGHHLTALALGLEAARHAPAPEIGTHVAAAQDLAKRLLQEVRRVVGQMREEPPLDLSGALAALAEGIDQPRVHLSIPPGLRVDDPERAHALVRCAQEVLTNAMRHAGARNLWLELAPGADGVELRARDDGRGAAAVAAGNGLNGMRERLERLGGRLAFESAPGGGFRVTAWLPLPSLATLAAVP